MQANQTPVIWTVIICTIIALIAGFLLIGSVKVEAPDVPTAEEIAALINVPDAPTAAEIAAEMGTLDSAKLDKVCKLTEGCEYWENDDTYGEIFTSFSTNDREDATEDFEEAMADLVSIDEDYFNLLDFDERDTQIRAYTDDDKEDGNWEVKVFAKVEYEDTDEDEEEYIYVLITTVLDEEDYDSMAIEEVTRNFEFE